MKLENHPRRTRGARQVLKEAASDPELQDGSAGGGRIGGKPRAARDPLEGLASPIRMMTKNIMLRFGQVLAAMRRVFKGIWSDVLALCRNPKLEGEACERRRDGRFKEAMLEIQGEQVYSKPKFEAGVHRVQRVPVTEAGVAFTLQPQR